MHDRPDGTSDGLTAGTPLLNSPPAANAVVKVPVAAHPEMVYADGKFPHFGTGR